MTRPRPSQSSRRWAAVLALALPVWFASAAPARAETTIFEALDAPIVRINVRDGDVTIRTWQRAAVSVDGPAGLVVRRRVVQVPAEQIPLFIPGAGLGAGPGAGGRAEGGLQLPPESFVVSSIPYGPREQIIIKTPPGFADPGSPAAPVSVTVPADAVFVSARTGSGNLEIHDYRAGTFVGFTGRGRLALYSGGGTAFVQTGRGALRVSDSSFDRLRARSVGGNMIFERCRVRQIEATSATGSLVFDGGAFEPGLARFESGRGDVAVGAGGPLQIAAHASGAGKVFTSFERGARVDGRDGTATAVVAGGGPLVTATTQAGNVYLYDGSLRGRGGALPPQWQAPLGTLLRPAEHPVRLDPPAALPASARPFFRPQSRRRPATAASPGRAERRFPRAPAAPGQ